MNKLVFLQVALALAAGCASLDKTPPVKIIFDTDIGDDADDLGALVMLNHFVRRGECQLLAVMSWSHERSSVPAIDAVNRFYGNPDIPIGVRKDPVYVDPKKYTVPIAEQFPYERTTEDAPDAIVLYRLILSAQKDKDVTLVTVGPLLNIKRLIESPPDSISNLSGKDLISRKIREVVIMGGHFPAGQGEWNFWGNMPGVTKFVLENLDVPVTFSGFEVGQVIRTGKVFNDLDEHHPLYVGFLHFCRHAEWMQPYQGRIIDNSTFDQTAVLYAVRGGVDTYWEKVQGGYCRVEDNGDNQWVEGKITNHSYLRLKETPEKMAALIESIMLGSF